MVTMPAKGQKAALHITPSEKSRLQVGLCWDIGKGIKEKKHLLDRFITKTEESDITFDLDLFCCIYDASGALLEMVTPENAFLMDESEQIYHSGDNQTGRIEGDDEFISINLTKVPEKIHSIVFVAQCNDDLTFGKVVNPEARVADGASDQNQYHIEIGHNEGASFDSLVFASISRDPQTEHGWALKNITEYIALDSVENWGETCKKYL